MWRWLALAKTDISHSTTLLPIFETEEPYIIIKLDENCRRQQFNEGWFKSVEQVPEKAISMSIKQIMKSKHIICSVPDERKAEAVKNCIDGTISNMFFLPAFLQSHPNCVCYFRQSFGKTIIGRESEKVQLFLSMKVTTVAVPANINKQTSQSGRNNLFPILIIGCLFAVFGFVSWLNSILIPYLRIACELSGFESYLVTFAFLYFLPCFFFAFRIFITQNRL